MQHKNKNYYPTLLYQYCLLQILHTAAAPAWQCCCYSWGIVKNYKPYLSVIHSLLSTVCQEQNVSVWRMNIILVLFFKKQRLLIQIKLGKAMSKDSLPQFGKTQFCPAKVFAFSSMQSSSLTEIVNAIINVLVICPTIYLNQKLRP